MPFIPDDPPKNPKELCTHPEHVPPSMWVPPSSGTWVCPKCGYKTPVKQTKITW